ncbi:MAG: MBL fold metallo-hydrolase [Gammaproteobacteria bacterium]|nr:MBL fold metallo-hydrolase [Gammaproteobacteria bacterium]MDH4314363.1 MBL fold metallo-hydrolase [Gammaproteobacteria bacterium]MDH5214201.1 MBL fold metallo-hydrolase [Gammaproteobacteria bacterium]
MRCAAGTLLQVAVVLLPATIAGCGANVAPPTEFCLRGKLDLGARLQGMQPRGSEFSDTSWCVVTDDNGQRVRFIARGKSNPDMDGDFVVDYLPPDTVRIIDDAGPDLEIHPASISDEARRYRWLDPVRLVQDLQANSDWVTAEKPDGWKVVTIPGSPAEVSLRIVDGDLFSLLTTTDLPLRGRVPVAWTWTRSADGDVSATLEVDGDILLRAQAGWRLLAESEASLLWQPKEIPAPIQIPGHAWPARVAMQLESLADGVFVVNSVRTGFSHLVIDTVEGLVIADAPAGWVEFPQVPPADLVPGLGVSGLSEQFVDFLARELPGRPIRAVALTHAHDDHAGGARAFAAAGATIYAPAEVSDFLQEALNRGEMPADRFTSRDHDLAVVGIRDRVMLPDATNSVAFVSLGASPHVSASLGVHAVDAGLFYQSDLHVPNSDAETPRTERAATECWFARWAVDNLPDETIVINSHSDVKTPVSRLAKYLQSEPCQ